MTALLLTAGMWGGKWPKGKDSACTGHMLQQSPACASVSRRLPASKTKPKHQLLPCKDVPHAWRISKGELHVHSPNTPCTVYKCTVYKDFTQEIHVQPQVVFYQLTL